MIDMSHVTGALSRGHTAIVPLPPRALTLLPPWWWLILWAGKRVENRAPSVAGRLRGWRGWLTLTASNVTNHDLLRLAGATHTDMLEFTDATWSGPAQWTLRDALARGGHVVALAELIDVHPNGPTPSDPWAHAGEHGLRLGTVLEVDPVPCVGGRGAFWIGACAGCGMPGPRETDGAMMMCRKCKLAAPVASAQPMVIVRRVC